MKYLVAILGIVFLSLTSPAFSQGKQLYMLDFVFMNKGYNLSDRDKHNQNARPIAARHGVKLKASLDAKHMLLGPKGLNRLDLWTLPHPSALGAWGKDPAYKKIEPNAKKIHDFNQLTLYLGKERMAAQIRSGNIYYVELLTFDKRKFSGREFISYMKNHDTVASEYGLKRIASFNPLSKILGKGPQASWLSIYVVQSMNHFKKWPNDKRYQKLNLVRKNIFETNKSLIGLFKAN